MLWLLSFAHASPPGLDATVFIEQGSAACAGAFVDEGVVVTAYHCVAPGGRPKVRTRDGRYSIGRVGNVDRGQDLALISVPGFAAEPSLTIAAGPGEPGDDVEVYGHPLGALLPGGFFAGTLRWSVSAGVLSTVGSRAIQITAPVNPGNSGGPVVDADGELIGVVSRRLRGDGMGFAGRAERVEELLSEPPRRLSPLGGTVAAEVVVQANGVAALPISVGGRAEAALRDRVVISGSAFVPIGSRWQAMRFGASEHQPFELRGALRQRIGRGPWTGRVDALFALAWVDRLTSADDDPLDIDRVQRTVPMVGGRLAFRNVALEYAVGVGDPFVRMSAVWRYPGTLFVF